MNEIERLKEENYKIRSESVSSVVYKELLNKYETLKRQVIKAGIILQSNEDYCIVCGEDVSDLGTMVCPNCGAKMDLKERENNE